MWHLFIFHQNKPHPHVLEKASSSPPHIPNGEQVMPSPGAGKNSRGEEEREGVGSQGRNQGAPALVLFRGAECVQAAGFGVFSQVLLPKTSQIVGIKTPSSTVFEH